jgi:hypothetical protein
VDSGRACSSSSSSGATTSIAECFALLNTQFPIIAILDAASPIPYFLFLHTISYVILPSIFGLPYGLVNIGFHSYTFLTILSSDIRCKWPNQLNLRAFT